MKSKATITDTQRLDMVKQFTRFNPFVIQRGEDPRAVMDATIVAAKKIRDAHKNRYEANDALTDCLRQLNCAENYKCAENCARRALKHLRKLRLVKK